MNYTTQGLWHPCSKTLRGWLMKKSEVENLVLMFLLYGQGHDIRTSFMLYGLVVNCPLTLWLLRIFLLNFELKIAWLGYFVTKPVKSEFNNFFCEALSSFLFLRVKIGISWISFALLKKIFDYLFFLLVFDLTVRAQISWNFSNIWSYCWNVTSWIWKTGKNVQNLHC